MGWGRDPACGAVLGGSGRLSGGTSCVRQPLFREVNTAVGNQQWVTHTLELSVTSRAAPGGLGPLHPAPGRKGLRWSRAATRDPST